jgi:hypothetical protein
MKFSCDTACSNYHVEKLRITELSTHCVAHILRDTRKSGRYTTQRVTTRRIEDFTLDTAMLLNVVLIANCWLSIHHTANLIYTLLRTQANEVTNLVLIICKVLRPGSNLYQPRLICFFDSGLILPNPLRPVRRVDTIRCT